MTSFSNPLAAPSVTSFPRLPCITRAFWKCRHRNTCQGGQVFMVSSGALIASCTSANIGLPIKSEDYPMPELAKLAVFLSGGGSNFKAIHKAVCKGQIKATIACVVSDKLACGGCQYAVEQGIRVIQSPEPSGRDQKSRGNSLNRLLQDNNIDYIILAGYVKMVPGEVVAAFPRAIVNVHPSLLPAFGGKGFYGKRVHEAVVRSGARFTGATVHFVDNDYDTGPILAQRVVAVSPLESPEQLAARVLKEEHILYPEAIAALVDKRISWREDGVPVVWQAQ